ncbi:MAG TPA: AraC family transcriptional regulator [Candidatus Methylacidiphilales bacterium]
MESSDFFSKQVFRARIFQRPRPSAGGRALRVVCGGCEHCSADYTIERKRFPYWGFELVARGRGTVVCEGKEQVLGPGALFAYGPATAYRMTSDADDPLVKYFVDFAGPKAGRLLAETGFRAGEVARVFPPGEIAEAYDRLIDTSLEEAAGAEQRSALLFELLVRTAADRRVSLGAVRQRAFSTYRRCLDRLESLPPTHAALRSVEGAAKLCGIDSAYLCRLFRRFGKLSPYRYLLRRRMIEAADRLAVPGSLVKQVAEDLGFADPFHFSRVFKAFHQVAPSEFGLDRRG